MAYQVQCAAFEGPLDLLVSLAYRGQIDLQNVPLRTIAEEFLSQVRAGPNLDAASETLVQLAVLTDLKARTLVPKAPPADTPPAPEETGPSDLGERLGTQMAEYLQFREAAQALRVLEDLQSRVFGGPQQAPAPDPDAEVRLDGVTLQDLFTAFTQVLHRAAEAPSEIAGERFTVGEKMEVILSTLQRAGGTLPFEVLFRDGASRLEIIVTFLALLELIKQRRIRARQARAFGEIEVMLAEAS